MSGTRRSAGTETLAGRVAIVVVVLPVLVAMGLGAFWVLTGRLVLGGDEPHYLVMAASLAGDGDLRLQDDYEEDARTGRIYGATEPHAYRTDRGWFPYHAPGLPVLLAPPFQVGGVPGARLGMAVLAAPLPIALLLWLRRRVSASTAVWLTLAVTGSVAFCHGATQIYPDLPAGVAATVLALWLLRGAGLPSSPAGSALAWAGFWTMAGLLPWLNVKFAAPWLVLVGWGGITARNERGSRERSPALALAPLAALGPAALAAYHYWAFGTVLGARGHGELTTSALRAAMIFLGLHLDQAQGLFLQQPLFLAGVPVIVIVARRERRTAVLLGLLYLSLIAPNALEMARYGGGGPSGRFGWSAAWLWTVPIGLAVAWYRDLLERWVRPAAVAALLYQLALAIRWVPDPAVLLPALDERLWARNSLFPVPWRYSLPSFYFWDSRGYLTYLPNLVALAGVALLVASGVAWSRRGHARPLRHVWVAFLVISGVLLPVAPPARDGSAEENQRLRGAVRDATSEVARRFEAERLNPRSLEGTSREDAEASGGLARATRPARSDRLIVFGPYIDLAPGVYRAVLAIRLPAEARAGRAGTFLVTAGNGRVVLARREVDTASLRADRYTPIEVSFEAEQALAAVEFKFVLESDVDLLLDYVDLLPLLPHPPSETDLR